MLDADESAMIEVEKEIGLLIDALASVSNAVSL